MGTPWEPVKDCKIQLTTQQEDMNIEWPCGRMINLENRVML